MNTCECKHDMDMTTNAKIDHTEANKVLQSRIDKLINNENEDQSESKLLHTRIDELINIINERDASIVKLSETHKICIDKFKIWKQLPIIYNNNNSSNNRNVRKP